MNKLIFCIVLAGISFVTFHSVQTHKFVWSDFEEIVARSEVQMTLSQQVKQAFTQPSDSLYAPIATTAQILQIQAARRADGTLDPKVFHSISLALHTANAILVFLILSFCFKTTWPVFIGSALFLVHPLQVETIAWAAASKFLLCGTFSFAALWQYGVYARKRDRAHRRTSQPILHFWVATCFFVMGLLTLPSAAIIAPAAFIIERMLPKKDSLSAPRKPMWPTLLWSVIAIPIVFVAISLQNTTGLATQLSFWSKPLIAADALAFYIHKIFLPLGIGPDYGRSPTFLFNHWVGYLSWIAPVVLFLVLLFWREKARSWFAAGASLLVIGILPFLGFASFEAQSMSTVANRYAYLGMIGPALALAYFVSIPRKPMFSLLGLGAVIAFGWVSSVQLKNWKDDTTLWSYALSINPESPIAHNILADRHRVAGNHAKAKFHYEKVLAINSVSAEPHFHLAEIERLSGRHDEAIKLYKKTLELDNDFAGAHRSLGLALLGKGQFESALTHLNRLDNSDPIVALSKGRALAAMKKPEEAVKAFQKALGSTSTSVLAEAHARLGLILHQLGDKTQAANHLASSLSHDAENAEAHKVLGDIRFHSDRREEALPHYEKALKVYTMDPVIHHNLGSLHLAEKRYQRAADLFTKAFELNEKSGEILQDLAIANFKLKKFGLSIKQFKEALLLNKRLPTSHYYLGEMARWAGKNEQAIGRYYLALGIDKAHAPSHYRLGQHFMKNEKPQKALWHFSYAKRTDPEERRYAGGVARAKRALKKGTL